MAARHPSDSESIDALLAAAKQLVRQLEEVKSAEAHHERAHSRPRPRNASSKQSICKSDLAATFKAIVKEAQAQLTKLGELETREVEGHEPEEREAETQERQQGHVDQIPIERRLSERRAGDYNLRFPCLLSQLRKNMVVAIQDARQALRRHNVDERGYLILQVQHRWDASELTQLLRGAQASDRDDIKGFALARGDADCLHAQVAADTSLNLCDMEGFSEACASQQPKENFEEWIARPPGRVRYLICEPLSDHSINTLLDAGPQCTGTSAVNPTHLQRCTSRTAILGLRTCCSQAQKSTGSSFTEAVLRSSSAASETSSRLLEHVRSLCGTTTSS
jgi:hypothetical protein